MQNAFPRKFITRIFRDGRMARLKDNNTSAPFPLSSELNQGCVLAPTLLSHVFSAMLTYFRDPCVGINLSCRYDGSLFIPRRLQRKTKCQHDFLCAHVCDLSSASEAATQHEFHKFSNASNNSGLTISTKKAEVIPGGSKLNPTSSQKTKKTQRNGQVHVSW